MKDIYDYNGITKTLKEVPDYMNSKYYNEDDTLELIV